MLIARGYETQGGVISPRLSGINKHVMILLVFIPKFRPPSEKDKRN